MLFVEGLAKLNIVAGLTVDARTNVKIVFSLPLPAILTLLGKLIGVVILYVPGSNSKVTRFAGITFANRLLMAFCIADV